MATAASVGSAATIENNTEVTTVEVDAPSGINDGDLMIALINPTDARTVTGVPSGWTQIATNSINNHRSYTYWKTYSTGETSYTWTFSAACENFGGIVRLTGADTSDPVDQSATDAANQITTNWPAVTTTVDNTRILRFLSRADNYNAIFSTIIWDLDTQAVDDPGQNGAHHFEQVSAGSTGTQSRSSPYASATWVTQTLAINPAPPAAAGDPMMFHPF